LINKGVKIYIINTIIKKNSDSMIIIIIIMEIIFYYISKVCIINIISHTIITVVHNIALKSLDGDLVQIVGIRLITS